MKRELALSSIVILFTLMFFNGNSARATLSVTPRKSLNFSPCAGGDAAETIAPTSGAQYLVKGTPGATFDIFISPTTITLTNATGRLTISSLKSAPATTGKFDSAGNATVGVGGTRDLLSASQPAGFYGGKFALVVSSGNEKVSATSDVSLQVLASIMVSKVADLNFGTRAAGDPGKTISAGGQGSAAFLVQGEPNKQYLIVLPQSISLKNNSATSAIKVAAFTLNTGQTSTLPSTGRQTFNVGATADAINSGNTPGNYSGSLLISVTYQ